MASNASLSEILSSTRLDGSLSNSGLASANVSKVLKSGAASARSPFASDFVLCTPDRVRRRPTSASGLPGFAPTFRGRSDPSCSPFATPRKASSGPTLTPLKSPANRRLQIFATPLKNRTPRSSSSSSSSLSSDRFIPNRTNTDFERARFTLMGKSLTDVDKESMSPSEMNRQNQLKERLCGRNEGPLLAFRDKAKSDLSLPSDKLNKSLAGANRKISQVAERILDAPDILNDYYLSPIDWSGSNCLAVALNTHIYIWNATTGSVNLLTTLDSHGDYVCCLRWVQDAGKDILAVGDSAGDVALWDVNQERRVRVMSGHSDRVGSLSWREHILSSGSRSGQIHHSDVRKPDHRVQTVDAHTREVCGLEWSADGRQLASGGNDHLLKIWTAGGGRSVTGAEPRLAFTDHKAAVKALAWCPWQQNILASGAGTADRTLKIRNCTNGNTVKSVDTKSQVCSILWSEEYRELVSSHGIPNNQITLWKYPAMEKVADLSGHTDRVLALSMSADRSTVVSAGADETLQLWKCFPEPEKRRRMLEQDAAAHLNKSDKSKVINRSGIR